MDKKYDEVLLFKTSVYFFTTVSTILEILNALEIVKLSWVAILSPLWLPILSSLCVLLLLYFISIILSFFIDFPEDE